jgi:hypothetical protein
MYEDAPPAAEQEYGSAILDVNELPIEALVDHDDSVLSDALRRLVRDMDRPAENYAAHSSCT